jgi:hypothetical protein
MTAGSERTKQIAYYYPEPHWWMGEVDWLKILLLFFDSIAILLPRYMRGRERMADPILAGPLADAGLLEVLEPEDFVDLPTTQALADMLLALVSADAFNDLDRSVPYRELSYSRMGWAADVELAASVVDELRRRDLAQESRDGVSVPLHPVVRKTVLVLLSQLARDAGRRRGLDLHPVTSDPDAVSALKETLALRSMPSAGHIVTLDLTAVAIDLTSVPLDEVLGFREAHGREYQAYARDVRQFAALLTSLPEEDRQQLLRDRREELADRANELRRTARKAWRRPAASVGLGAVGAFWAAVRGDVVSAVLSVARGALGAGSTAANAGAYSYLFRAKAKLGQTTRDTQSRP